MESGLKGFSLGEKLKSANAANSRKYQKLPDSKLVIAVDS
jgi:hypothetical protein